MMRPDRTTVHGLTVFEVWPESARTILPDGAEIPAVPQGTEEYRQQAQALGYGQDTLRMCVEHEEAHVALAEWLGLPESPVMRMLATGSIDCDLAAMEEDVVLSLQRFANATGVNLGRRFAK